MQPLSVERRAQILKALCEGTSVRGTARITGASATTILTVLEKVGQACSEYQDEHIRGLVCDFVELDEIYSFIQKKGNDVWCWVALDVKSKLRITWHVGDRGQASAFRFCHDLSQRISGGAQISSDGLAAYRWAVTGTMPDCHYAQMIKRFTDDMQEVVSVTKINVQGEPLKEHISTSHVEASNLHMRMQNRRYARRTNAHSKAFENHCHMIALGFMAYNFIRRHHAHKQTPAMAAGIAQKPWTMEDVVRMADERQEAALNAEFEAAFAKRYSAPRTSAKSFEPRQPLTPWYLDPNSGGPNPPANERKPGIKYEDDADNEGLDFP